MSDEEADTPNSSPNRQPQLVSLSTRRLQSFPPPDLEVLVGPQQRIYRYHAVILAAHSEYVDTILSSPMAVRNQEKKRIGFTDIEEKKWGKMIPHIFYLWLN